MIKSNPELSSYVHKNKHGEDSIDFSKTQAVKTLNKAILNYYYDIEYWDFPDTNLCPPIPGRADYIHYVADLLSADSNKVPRGNKITCLDIGVGVSCIYPIISVVEYGWNCIGSDINKKSLEVASTIISSNPLLRDRITCRLQKNKNSIFTGIVQQEDKIDVTICNPPFHSTMEDAQKGTRRKNKNLHGEKTNPKQNFSGEEHELIFPGGEKRFIEIMIKESQQYSKNVLWFTTLVSKQSNLKFIENILQKSKAIDVREINMGTGNKSTRIVAWTYFSKKERQAWLANK